MDGLEYRCALRLNTALLKRDSLSLVVHAYSRNPKHEITMRIQIRSRLAFLIRKALTATILACVGLDSASASVAKSERTLMVDSKSLRVAADNKEWSFQSASPNSQRFEVRKGDIGDDADFPDRQRSEIVARNDAYREGTEIWQSFSIKIEVADGFRVVDESGMFAIVMQWHSIDFIKKQRSPVLLLDFSGNRRRIQTRSDAELKGTNGIPKLRYSAPLPSVGAEMHYVFNFRLGKDGFLKVWENGVQVVNLGDIAIGYFSDPHDLGYLQWGIYSKAVPERMAVTTENMEWGTRDLSERIDHPL